ncbi:MAG: hydroxymethylglutaryl-CoA synthase family protein, partial [Dehalococcoidia bacterium]|nr:hydroxymethylglutaryl-CoA synthase family protein [Dehalococcoidia bacterium]
MTGIVSYAPYLPLNRLDRAEIGRSWGKGGKGEKAVASFDEDTLTMAVAVAQSCLKGIDRKTIDGLFFASTTAPYAEKQTAATVAAVLGMGAEVYTADFGNSLRASTNALRAAVDAVNSGSLKNVLVCAAERRLALPNGAGEMAFGDGAGALLIGKEGVVASIDSMYTMSDEIIDVFRSDTDRYVKSWEVRFVRDDGHGRVVPQAIRAALDKNGETLADFSKIVMYSPDARQLGAVTKAMKLDPEKVQDSFFTQFGDTGNAQVFITLAAALEQAKAGDRMMVASYGNG